MSEWEPYRDAWDGPRSSPSPPPPPPEAVERGRQALRPNVLAYARYWAELNKGVRDEPRPGTVWAHNTAANPFRIERLIDSALVAEGVVIDLVDNARQVGSDRPAQGAYARYVPAGVADGLKDMGNRFRVVNDRPFLRFLWDVLDIGLIYSQADPAKPQFQKMYDRVASDNPWPERTSREWIEAGFMTSLTSRWTERYIRTQSLAFESEAALPYIDEHGLAAYGALALRPRSEGGPVRPFNFEQLAGLGHWLVREAQEQTGITVQSLLRAQEQE